MKRYTAVLVLILAAVVAGCGSIGGATPTATPTADIQLTSIGQDPVGNGTAVEVVGVAKNYGDAEAETTAVVQLLDGDTTIAERQVGLGTLSPDESVSFSVTLSVNASEVNGRTITFE